MSVNELRAPYLESVWRQVAALAGGHAEERRARIEAMLAQEGPYGLYLIAADGSAGGLAVVEHYDSAWIFADRVAAIREFLSAEELRGELLHEIEQRARAAGMTHLSRFTTAGDPLIPWWYESGFAEYMAAYRRDIDGEEAPAGTVTADDGVRIREVTDLESDWPRLWPLFEKLNQHHAALTGRPLNESREESARRGLAAELAGGEALVLIAEAGSRAVATSTAELGEPHADGTRTGYRSRLYVEEAHRGRGLSARFEATALCWLRARGATEVERWIVAGNERPRQIWSRRGYRAERLLLRKALD